MKSKVKYTGYLVKAYSLEPVNTIEENLDSVDNIYGFVQVSGIFKDTCVPNIAFAYQSQIQHIIKYSKEEYSEIKGTDTCKIIEVLQADSISEDGNTSIDVAVTVGNEFDEIETFYYRIEIVQ